MTETTEVTGTPRAEPTAGQSGRAVGLMQRIAHAQDEEEYRELRDQLCAMGDTAIPAMREALASANTRQRMAAACNLGRLGDYASIPDLIGLLGDPIGRVREMALFGLGVLGRAQAVGPVLSCLGDHDPDVRVRTLIALRDLRYKQLKSVLVKCMRDDAYGVREQALSFLRTEPCATALPVVLLALLEPEYKMQTMAEAALDRVVPLAETDGFPGLADQLTPRQVRLVMNYLESRNLQHVWPSMYGQLSGLLGSPASDRGLDRYGRILTGEEELEFLDHAFLRDDTVDLLLDHYCEANTGRSVLLVGPAGSGKTSIVHEFVRRLAASSNDVTVLETNTSELMTGTRYLGEWETKLKDMTDAILRHPTPVVVYMKNPNDLLGAGAHSKSDESFADFFKPYLERGDLRMLAETTPDMLKGGLSRDPGFLRLFQQIRVEKMSRTDTTEVLEKRLPHLQGRGKRPVQADWQTLEHITDLARSFYTRSDAPGRACDLMDAVVEHIGREQHKLLPPEAPLKIQIPDVPRALAKTTGIDLTLLDDELMLDLDAWSAWFSERLVAQQASINAIVDRVALVKAGLRDPDKPLGTMFLVGPTGVGKTYFARLVAERLFGDADRMVRFDLSEFQGRYAVDKLVGVPHDRDREGLLTEAIHQQPYCVLLLDEFEKADAEVHHLFLQVLDEGRLTDARGKTADFRQALILMTSNLGASRMGTTPVGFGGKDSSLDGHIRSKMDEVFQPEFINRLDNVVVFQPLDETAIRRLVDLEVAKLAERRGFRRHQLSLVLSDAAAEYLATEGFSARFGARELKRVIETQLLTHLSRVLVGRRASDRPAIARVDVAGDGLTIRVIEDDVPVSPDPSPAVPDGARSLGRFGAPEAVEPRGGS